ncbi:MAG: NAD(P)-dependent oxidoreductase [Oscillospiraceae bacterium]
MKIFVYSCRDDEKVLFDKYEKDWNLELGFCKTQPLMENAHLAKGYPCISIVGTIVSDELLREFADMGVKLIATRSIGYEHVNTKLARELGITVASIVYSPNAVADFAIMLMLMSLRKAKYILERYRVRDNTLLWNRGRELRNMTVGIVGGGRIGRTVMQELSGFGCKLLVYDKFQNDAVKKMATYVEFDELLAQSDVISFHAPSTPDTYHLLNMDSVKKLKKGAVIINTSRGALIDNKALIYGLEQKIISAVGIDVIDGEPVVYNVDFKDELFIHHDVAVLESYPNVIITPHTAFFTDQAVSDMVENSLRNCVCFYEGEKIPGQVN